MINYSEACERNKEPLFAVLDNYLPDASLCSILEVGSGSGQHAVHFTRQRPNWVWQTSEMPEHVPALKQNLLDYGSGLAEPIVLDVDHSSWPVDYKNAVLTVNTLHIMPASSVESFFAGLAGVLANGGHLFIYGPFRYQGEFTSPSNAEFDLWLKRRNPDSGIRDFEWIQTLANQAGFRLVKDIAMPANNQCLVWIK